MQGGRFNPCLGRSLMICSQKTKNVKQKRKEKENPEGKVLGSTWLCFPETTSNSLKNLMKLVYAPNPKSLWIYTHKISFHLRAFKAPAKFIHISTGSLWTPTSYQFNQESSWSSWPNPLYIPQFQYPLTIFTLTFIFCLDCSKSFPVELPVSTLDPFGSCFTE